MGLIARSTIKQLFMLAASLLASALSAAAEDVRINLSGGQTRSYGLSSEDPKLEGTVGICGFGAASIPWPRRASSPSRKATGSAVIAAVETVCGLEPVGAVGHGGLDRLRRAIPQIRFQPRTTRAGTIAARQGLEFNPERT